jgi:GDP-L-fucose synthase
VGTSEDLTIREIADMVGRIVGYKGEVRWDRSKPDGMPQKLLDISKVRRLGWSPSTPLEVGIKKAYEDFLGR